MTDLNTNTPVLPRHPPPTPVQAAQQAMQGLNIAGTATSTWTPSVSVPMTTNVSSNTNGSQWLGGETPRSQARTLQEVSHVGIGVNKRNREQLKQTDRKSYYKVKESTVAGMESKFTQLKEIDQNASVEHFKMVYSVITRFEDLQAQMIKNDLADVFTIPSAFSYDTITNSYVPASTASSINLFSDASQVELSTVRYANAYFMEFGKEYHGENIVWSGEKILNSCDAELRDKLIEQTRNWPETQKGGPTYLKLLLPLILSTTEKSLRSLTDKLSRLKLTDFDGENVTKAVSFICGVVLILQDNRALPDDLTSLTLRIFKASSCEAFKLHVTNIDSLVELQIASYDFDTLLTNLDTKYIELVGRNEWTPLSTTKGQNSSFNANFKDVLKIICFNCGGIGHGVNSCPHPKDDNAINLHKEIMSNFNSSNGSRNDRRGNGRDGNQGNGGGNGGGNPCNPLVVPPRRGEAHEKMFDGVMKYWCGKPGCRHWTDHKSADHPPSGNSAEVPNEDNSSEQPSSAPTEDGSTLGTSTLGSSSGEDSANFTMFHFGSAV